MDVLDPIAEQAKDVYAHFGLAAYQAQCVERQLAILLATEFGPGIENMTSTQYDESLGRLFRQTLGGLIRRLSEANTLPQDFVDRLEDALRTRNWLTHNYFWDRAGHFMSQDGRESMKAELLTISRQLGELDEHLIQISRVWMDKVGMTDDVLRTEQENLVRAAGLEIAASQ